MPARPTRPALFLALSILIVAGCEETNLPSRTHNVEPITHAPSDAIIHYGGGVYYFDYTGAEYGNALAYFLKTHPSLTISSAEGYVRNGLTLGYFVTFTKN